VIGIDEALGARQRRFELAGFAHHLNDLGKPFHVDLALLGHHAAIRFESALNGEHFEIDSFARKYLSA
jgi:hypothetical protein